MQSTYGVPTYVCIYIPVERPERIFSNKNILTRSPEVLFYYIFFVLIGEFLSTEVETGWIYFLYLYGGSWVQNVGNYHALVWNLISNFCYAELWSGGSPTSGGHFRPLTYMYVLGGNYWKGISQQSKVFNITGEWKTTCNYRNWTTRVSTPVYNVKSSLYVH